MRRAGFGLAASLMLAACEGGLPDLRDLARSAGGSGKTDAVGQERISVTAREVALSGPRGFCVDPVSTQNDAAQAFVVFGNCAAITGNPDQPQPYAQAVVTATVTSSGLTGEGAIAPQTEELISFFRSVQGRAALSRTADATSVSVSEGFSENGSIYLHVGDTGEAPFEGAQDSYWRGYFDAGTSVVALSVIGLGEPAITKADGLSVLRDFVERNARPPVVAATTPATATGQTPGLLDRLFP